MGLTATGFEMRATRLLVACLGALQDGGDALKVDEAGVVFKRKRTDQCVGVGIES
jgi:hypothetical protein